MRTSAVGPLVRSWKPQERHDAVHLLHFALLSLSFSPRRGPSRHCCSRSDMLARARHHTTAYQIPPTASPWAPLPLRTLQSSSRALVRLHSDATAAKGSLELYHARGHHGQPLWHLHLPLHHSIARCLGNLDAHASGRPGHRGRSWPVHTAQHRHTCHCRQRALPTHPRKPVVPHSVRNRVGSMRVALVSPADSLATSFTVGHLLPCLSATNAQAWLSVGMGRSSRGSCGLTGPGQWVV
jgi:hypothetical protein